MVFCHCGVRLLVLADKRSGADITVMAMLAGNALVTAAVTDA